jgi:zinc ribbon protein
MFCQKCGTQIPDNATACPKCGAATTPGAAPGAAPATPPPGGTPASFAADKVKAASKDAFQAFKMFASNPVGGLPGAFENLGAKALGAGVFFGALCSLCFFLLFIRMFGGHLGFGGYVRLIFASFVPFLALALANFIVRLFFGGTGGLRCDPFIAGASLLPLGIFALVGAILGVRDQGVFSMLSLFATCIPVLMLFSGLTRICKLSERVATAAVPLMVLICLWLTQTIYRKMIESAISSQFSL